MRCLFLDTASHNIVVAVSDGAQLLGKVEVENDTSLSSRILPIIDQVLTDSITLAKEIDKIFVVTGPGSFTGTRVGVTIAKTYAWALKKEMIPLSELEFLATTKVNTTYKIPLIDARRGYVYAAIYDQKGNIILPDQYIELSSLLKKIPTDGTCSFLSYDTFELETITPIPNCMQIIVDHFKDKGLNPHKVNPNYLKKTEAEEKLEQHD